MAMFGGIDRLGLARRLGHARRWLAGRRGGVLMMYALAAPLLIAGTGLAVDVGYWYQEQTALQSAADAAAMAAAQGAVAYDISSTSTTTMATYTGSSGAGTTIALAAANNATAAKYNFASAGNTMVLTGVYPSSCTATSTSCTISLTATVTAPRSLFFAAVKGLGIAGMPTGTQKAKATVAVAETLTSASGGTTRNNGGCTSGAACECADITGNLDNGAGQSSGLPNGKFTMISCGGFIGGTMSTESSGDITGSFISSGQSSAASGIKNLSNGYIGTGTASGGTTSGVLYGQTDQTNALASMGAPPAWPTMPSAVQSSSYKTPSLPNVNAGSWQGLNNISEAYTTFNYDSSTFTNTTPSTGTGGTSYFSGGIGGSPGDGTTFYGSTYYFYNGGITWGSSWSDIAKPYINLWGSYYNVQGGSNYAVILPSYTDNVGSVPTTSTPASQSQWNQFYFQGGMELSGNATSITLASGLYEFSIIPGDSCTESSCWNGAAFFTTGGGAPANNPTITFGNCTATPAAPSNPTAAQIAAAALACTPIFPSTYYFKGGLDIIAGFETVNFEPGIYYITNGPLIVSSGATINANGVTFVLEGTNAGFIVNGGGTLNLSAPTLASDPNCVSPISVSGAAYYPESAYTGSNFPYDGTNGHGICDVAIYQPASDTTADTIDEGGTSVINGSIYTPGAALTVSGGGSLSVTSKGYASISVASVSMSGGGNISLTENAPDTSTTGGSGGSGNSSGSNGTSGSGSSTKITSAVFLLVG